ncbi:endo alpha-1,4 polygalactosaminidase [Actinoplanes sp. Pm04-4]|uniref:Endo alpha-1,4 polygalactosaminidase n=1 Tax=Paractinoplanes pyxinae TaxID=2997416 RepID=A0ABT4AYN6_9ACTN|nr:endo alpha-1,4 polygalactosaminidase [Actinoplanes pyxinae]MCY1139325.1 endo alpha-1,4 polygalactosaminidase [Actinoplanes pyxinae]
MTVAATVLLAVAACSTPSDPAPAPDDSLTTAQSGPAPSLNETPDPARSLNQTLNPTADPARSLNSAHQPTAWAYQLQNYKNDRLDELAAGRYQTVVIDLARDGHSGWFTSAEIAHVRATGKRVLAYFEIGSIENFRPEYPGLDRDLIANEWTDWPGEYFVRYWDERWWRSVVRSRIDRALSAGFDGAYLDTPLAYEEISLSFAQGNDRNALALKMASLIARISAYAKARDPDFLVVPQNSPELRHQPGYTAAIDGIGMEELFFKATDERCAEDWCAENLADTRALRDAGKFVLSVDYATRPADVRAACDHYASERFTGTVTVLDLDRPGPPCPRK